MRRIPDQSGKESASNIPDWARPLPRHVGERPVRYAERLMDWYHGGRRNWEVGAASRGPRSDFNRIKKHGERAYENPRQLFLFHDGEDPEA